MRDKRSENNGAMIQYIHTLSCYMEGKYIVNKYTCY